MVWMCFEQKSRNCTLHIPAKISFLGQLSQDFSDSL